MLQRFIDSADHHVSERHFDRYLEAFDYCYSARNVEDGERTVDVIHRTAGRRLRHGEPTDDQKWGNLRKRKTAQGLEIQAPRR